MNRMEYSFCIDFVSLFYEIYRSSTEHGIITGIISDEVRVGGVEAWVFGLNRDEHKIRAFD